jgi:hypothetical protein
MIVECEMCAPSKWKSACPECDGTGKITMSEKIKYWWSEDRQFFCILVDDGVAKATVSLTVEEAEALMDEVMQTPSFLKLQEQAHQRATQLMEQAAAADLLPCPHCGGKADFNNDGERWDQVICGGCGCRGCEHPNSREKAAAAWNRRVPPPRS